MEFEVIRSSRKTLVAEIKYGKLIIRAPLQASNEDINRFILEHKHWIETHLEKAQAAEKAAKGTHKLTMEEIRALADRALKVIHEGKSIDSTPYK